MAESHGTARRIGERIVHAMIVVGVFHLFWRFGGLLVNWLVSRFFGPSAESDAFFYATEKIVLLFYFVGEESLGPSFLPVFIQELEKEGEEKAWEFASTVLNAALVALTLGVVAGVLLAPQLTDLVAPGFREGLVPWMGHGARRELTIHLVKWMLPGLIGLSVGSLTYVIINGYKVFGYAAAGDAVQKITFFVVMLVAYVFFHMGLDSAAVGFLAGAAGKVLTHLIWLRRKLIHYRFTLVFRSSAMKRFAILLLPLILGILFAKFRDFITDRFKSYLATGIPSDISWAKKIGDLPITIVPYALGIAMFPFLCELWARRDREAMAAVISRGLQLVALFLLPLSVVTILLREPIIQMVYDRGNWATQPGNHIYYCGMALACYVSALTFYGVEMVLLQSFYSMQNTWLPVGIGIGFSGVAVLLLYATIQGLGITGAASFYPIVLAFPVAKAMKNVVLAILMRRRVPILPWATFSGYLWRLAVVTLVTGAAAYLAWTLCGRLVPLPAVDVSVKFSLSFEMAKAVRLALPSLAALAAFVLTAERLKMEEMRLVREWILAKARRRLPSLGQQKIGRS